MGDTRTLIKSRERELDMTFPLIGEKTHAAARGLALLILLALVTAPVASAQSVGGVVSAVLALT